MEQTSIALNKKYIPLHFKFAEFINVVQHKNTQTLLNHYGIMIKLKYRINQFFTKICMKRDYLISDLLDEDGEFIRFDDIMNKINKLPFTYTKGLRKQY